MLAIVLVVNVPEQISDVAVANEIEEYTILRFTMPCVNYDAPNIIFKLKFACILLRKLKLKLRLNSVQKNTARQTYLQLILPNMLSNWFKVVVLGCCVV